uniref:RRM domain-containing protein n=1 Tax=Heterorhabditis bacteriophora TaxID=37862 RepID=A0A1I7X719_HETBA
MGILYILSLLYKVVRGVVCGLMDEHTTMDNSSPAGDSAQHEEARLNADSDDGSQVQDPGGFGFITFVDPASVDKVLSMEEHELDGKKNFTVERTLDGWT